jgi:hypothetical protein
LDVEDFIGRWKSAYRVKFPEACERAAFFQAAAGVPAVRLAIAYP